MTAVVAGRSRVLICAALLAGCTVGPAYQDPTIEVPARFAAGGGAESAALAPVAWWQSFRDPVLNRLVRQGLEQNLDLAQAVERIEAAEATARASGAVLSGDASASVLRRGASDEVARTEATVGLGASWLIDIFGGSKRQRQAALSDLDAAAANARAARMALLSQVAAAYIDLRFYEAATVLKRRDLASRQLTLREVTSIFQAGEATQLELAQAEALLSTTRSEIPVLEASAQRQKNRLATLLGVPAGTLPLTATGTQPVPRGRTVAGVPADLVRNRPDVQRAEAAYAAAVARIGVAEAQLYPSLRLGGDVRVGRSDGAHVDSWSFGPSLSVPVFGRGRLRDNVDVAESAARQQHLAWRQSVLIAVEEVENALYGIGKYAQAADAASRAVRDYTRALELSRELSRNGEITILEVVQGERQIAQAREAQAQSLRRLALEHVALNVALGAGYAADAGYAGKGE
jgi:multidrug efflux system outer membrane protein